MAPLLLLLAACSFGSSPSTGGGVTLDADTDGTEPTTDSADIETVGELCDSLEHPALAVNELVSANIQGLLDQDEETPDWIELINLDDHPVDLDGWGLSDDPDDPFNTTLPAGALGPGEVLLVLASGKVSTSDELHAEFSLATTGDTVVLSAPDGCPVDQVETPRLYRDVAWGRAQSDPQSWGYFLEPTPGEPNLTESRPGFADVPELSPPAGFYTDSVSVSVTTTGDSVRVTLDGAAPTEEDTIYTAAFDVDARPDFNVVRARAWADGLWPSRIATATYALTPGLLDDDLQIVSLVVDPYDLYDEATGIYAYGFEDYTPYYPYFDANFWENWERDLHVTVFDTDGTVVVDQDAGVKIHGGYTRAFEQKNLRVLPRAAYGPATLDHKFFPNMVQDAFQVMVLEGAGDWCPTHTENSLIDQLFRDADGTRLPTIDTQAWEPTAVYLNGEFWGLYSFREKLDERYIGYHHGADPDDLDRIECTADGTDDWWRVSQGDWEAFDAFNEFAQTHDLSDPAHWETFTGMVDVENLATAVLAVGYMANGDWWSNNIKVWRERTDTSPFRHMVFDLGHGWGSSSYDHFGVSVAWSGRGLPISDALENEAFRVLLANQASDYLNTILSADHAVGVLDGMHARIEPLIPEQYALWCGEPASSWYNSTEYARNFVLDRPAHMWTHVRDGLGLAGTVEHSLDVEPAGAGSFALTAVSVEAPFSGLFWRTIPVTVTAIPAEGWTFTSWADGTGGAERIGVLSEPGEWVAVFEAL